MRTSSVGDSCSRCAPAWYWTIASAAFCRSSWPRACANWRSRIYDSYYQVVCAGIGGGIEWVRLLDRLTIQATRFFRHPPSFALLEPM